MQNFIFRPKTFCIYLQNKEALLKLHYFKKNLCKRERKTTASTSSNLPVWVKLRKGILWLSGSGKTVASERLVLGSIPLTLGLFTGAHRAVRAAVRLRG